MGRFACPLVQTVGLWLFILFIMIYILDNCNKSLKTFAGFMGKISLESYILNGALPRMMISLFVFAGNPLIGNVLPYLAACVIGTAVGWGIHNF